MVILSSGSRETIHRGSLIVMSSQYLNRSSATFFQIQNRTQLDQDFIPGRPSSLMRNRHRSYAGDFACLSELLVDQNVDENDIVKDFNVLRIKKHEPLDIQANSKTFTNYNSDTDDTLASHRKKTSSQISIDARVIDTVTQQVFQAGRCGRAFNRAARTDDNTFRVTNQEELRDAPPNPPAQLRQKRIGARLAAFQHDPASSNHPCQSVVWTEYKHWILCLVQETDLYIQFELRHKGEERCLTLFDGEAYFALVALIDCSENPRELIFDLSSPNGVLIRTDYKIILHNLHLLLELKKKKIKLKSSN